MISLPICGVFSGCALNVVFLELLTNFDKGSGNLITFAQFLFIATEGFIFNYKNGNKRKIPLKFYGVMVTLFCMFSLINNYALNFNIPMPLHIITRSGSLVANMILGRYLMKKKYSLQQVLGTILITMGICIFISASASNLASKNEPVTNKDIGNLGVYNILIMCIGILLLIIALVMSALTGLYQEELYSKFGKHSKEALFYSHFLPLPGFVILYKDLVSHSKIFNQSDLVWIIQDRLSIPIMWLYLMGNVITQSVFWMTSVYPSLTVTLVLTLRKFFSLLLSIYYFQAPFTTFHALGTLLVFYGTCLFYNVLSVLKAIERYVSKSTFDCNKPTN